LSIDTLQGHRNRRCRCSQSFNWIRFSICNWAFSYRLFKQRWFS